MSEPRSERQAALAQIDERWDGERTERTLAGAHEKLRRRRRRARASAYGAGLCLLGAAGLWATTAREAPNASTSTSTGTSAKLAPQQPALPPAGAPVQRMQLADGSEIALLDADARVVVKDVSPAQMTVELAAGSAHFEIVHRQERVFRVLSGDVTVQVLGTSFDLQREAARTRVSVGRGRVAVEWSDGRSELAAGEAGWFPKPLDAPESAEHAPAKPTAASPQSWREPAERGDFAHAYTLLAQTKHAASDDVEELMLAADTARLSGHPQAALPFLNRVVARHPEDARAALAAFTLGGVLMQELGRPREAEAAYARARALSLDSSLAQDALARQVEAANRAGDSLHAGKLATEYLARYPKGRRVHAVRRFGGLPAE
jgi:transmembrane sensor